MTTRQVTDDQLAPFLRELDAAIDSRCSAVLFGSGARGEWIEGRSNVNVLLVLDAATPAELRALAPAFRAFAAISWEPPLVIGRAEWLRAADVFALEIADMRTAYRVLRGDDPLPHVVPAKADLRAALEREFRGKLLQLRRGFVAAADDELALGALAARSVATFVLLARTALVLLDEPVPATSAAVLARAAERFGLDAQPLLRALDHRTALEWRCPADDFLRYLGAGDRVAQAVDHLPSGD